MSMFVCPVCKEANEEYRNYCKECGTWLLSNNFPSKQINTDPGKGINRRNPLYVDKTGLSGWLIVLFTIGTGLLLFFLFVAGIQYLYSFLALYGLVGLGLAILLALIFTMAGRFTTQKKELGVLLVVSVISIAGGIALSPENQPIQGQALAINGQAATQQKGQKPKATGQITYAVGDIVQTGKLTYQIKEVQLRKEIKNQLGGLQTNGIYAVLTVNVVNNDKKPRYVDQSMFKIHDSEGRTFDPDSKADLYLNNEIAFFLDNINPGLAKQAKIAFELPTGPKQLTVEVSSGLGLSGGESAFILLGDM